MIKTKENQNIYKIAVLVALSCVLQISESLIPHPIPGLRLGLANVITLISLVTMGFGYALEITILRTILGSFIMGTFMSPTFILSFSGGLISTLIMGLLYWLSCLHRRFRLSIVGISMAGALAHNIVQLYLAYFILVKHRGIFVFFPWLCIGAVIMGWLTGIVAGRVCLKLKEMLGQQDTAGEGIHTDYSRLLSHHYLPGKSFIHRIPSHIKIASVFIVSLAVLIFNSFWLYLGLFIFLATIIIISQTSFGVLFRGVRRYAPMMFASFLFPVFFNSGKHVLSHIAYFNITTEGLNMGLLFALRILFLICLSSLLSRTTSPKELVGGLAKILSPLRPLGISGERTAAIFSLSWIAIPIFWEMARNIIRGIDLKKVRNLYSLIPLLSDFIARFYLETEQLSIFWDDDYKDQSYIRKEADVYSVSMINR